MLRSVTPIEPLRPLPSAWERAGRCCALVLIAGVVVIFARIAAGQEAHGQEQSERVRAAAEQTEPTQVVQARADKKGDRGAARGAGRPADREAPRAAAADAGEEALTLALLVARVAANEGAFDNPRELDLIWQVVEGWARDNARRLEQLRQHSSRVAGLRPCRSGNCRWSRYVRSDGTLPAEVAAGFEPEPGWWLAARAERMRALVVRAEQLVAGAAYTRPCDERPTTWGGPMDHGHAQSQGLVPVRCNGTINTGYRPAPREVRP
jgi:hypothetical protein